MSILALTLVLNIIIRNIILHYIILFVYYIVLEKHIILDTVQA